MSCKIPWVGGTNKDWHSTPSFTRPLDPRSPGSYIEENSCHSMTTNRRYRGNNDFLGYIGGFARGQSIFFKPFTTSSHTAMKIVFSSLPLPLPPPLPPFRPLIHAVFVLVRQLPLWRQHSLITYTTPLERPRSAPRL